MKIFALAFVLMIGNVSAETPEFLAKKHTCAELKANLANYKEIIISKKILGIKKRLWVDADVTCSGYNEIKQQAWFKTKDVQVCEVGFFCAYDRPASSWSSGSSSGDYYYESGYSYGSSSDSGSSSSDSSSSGSSSSGSSTGPSYNPPSSGTTGPSYNPPSSGSRGPRYCPGCAQ